jgi:choloylglycine hydrolase
LIKKCGDQHVEKTLLCSFIASSLFFQTVQACTRAVYLGNDNHIITARSMDWKVDVGTNLWIMPSGVERDSNAGSKSLKWKSKYGSVIASGYDISTTDGMNEAGLVANVLWLVESQYPDSKTIDKPN